MVRQKKGTKINFLPSKKIFSSIKFSPSILEKRIRELAFLNKGIKITFKDLSQKKLFAFSAKPFDRIFLFNDNLNKGWKAKMNNANVEIINVNFFAMGVFLPKNTEIELLFEYKPKWSKIHKITLIMSFITLCVFNLLLAISPINKYFINSNK